MDYIYYLIKYVRDSVSRLQEKVLDYQKIESLVKEERLKEHYESGSE